MNTPFQINNQPFFILGGQVHNSSGYSGKSMEAAWQALKILRANTAEVPVYWEQVEPSEGTFEFGHLDEIIQGARARELRLVLLWFATWKNGSMQYAPEWVKANPTRFPRVITPGGTETWVLSSHFEETFQADQRAFCRLLEHLQDFDGAEQTVIGVQIENEPGILGSVRDYSPTAEAQFASAVPEAVLQVLGTLKPGPLQQGWEKSGAKKVGTWQEVFGSMSAEAFSTWSIARYIDRLAEAGKKVYPLPLYVNVWLGENGWQLPGVNYPSGGAVSVMLDLWKAASPHIDLIAPDIYLEPSTDYNTICRNYQREDNLLFIPESGLWMSSNALNLFDAIASYHAVGVAVFGVESLLDPNGGIRPESQAVVESFHTIQAMLPMISKYHASEQLQAVIQREYMANQLLDLGDFLGLVTFANREEEIVTDFAHRHKDDLPRGRGLVLMANQREIYLAGSGYRLLLKEKQADERRMFAQSHDHFDGALTHYLRVEEGHFAPTGEWHIDRMRNGDEITNGLWISSDVGVVHALIA